MGILNYSTKISSEKSCGEIQGMLGQKGAQYVSCKYENGEAVGICFSIDMKGKPVNFQLPCNWPGVLAAFKKDRKIPRSAETERQAKMTAWRIVKDWVEAQLALIEAGQADMAEVFLPYAVTTSGQSLYQKMLESPKLLIGN